MTIPFTRTICPCKGEGDAVPQIWLIVASRPLRVGVGMGVGVVLGRGGVPGGLRSRRGSVGVGAGVPGRGVAGRGVTVARGLLRVAVAIIAGDGMAAAGAVGGRPALATVLVALAVDVSGRAGGPPQQATPPRRTIMQVTSTDEHRRIGDSFSLRRVREPMITGHAPVRNAC